MIFYFTGTGNSKYVAQALAHRLDTPLISIAEVMRDGAVRDLVPDEPVGVVFPIYAWAPPEMVRQFVHRFPFVEATYAFAVCTCGDDAGNAMRVLAKRRGKAFDAVYSVTMPNNYIIGFDVDPEPVVAQKLADAKARIGSIGDALLARKRGVEEVNRGRFAGLKTAIAAPFFDLGGRRTKPFHAHGCIACGRCAQVCPTRNVTVADAPTWGNDCAGCLACLHYCPVRAIDYGRGTQHKGRYVNPDCDVTYRFDK